MPSRRSSSGHGLPSNSTPDWDTKLGDDGGSGSPSRQEGDHVSRAATTTPSPPPLTTLTALDEAETIMEGIESESFERNAKPMGFRNDDVPRYPTNVCYRNSVISMLLNIPTFSKLLTAYQTRQEEWQADPNRRPRNPAPMFASLVELNRLYWEDSRRRKQIRLDEAMDAFFQEFTRVRPKFTRNEGNNYWRQEDAEEFLGQLFIGIEAELVGNDVVISNALEALFTYGLLPRTHCVNGCRAKKLPASKINRENIRRFHLQGGLPDGQTHTTFREALDASFVGSEDRDCQICKGKQWKVDRFVELPKIFLTAFDRNSYTGDGMKIETDCPLPLTYVPDVDKNSKQNCKYRLAGVVSHVGAFADCGHYISYVPSHAEPGEWYRIDDAKVKRIKFKEINNFIVEWEGAPEAQMLPFLTAWELIDESTDKAEGKNEREAARGIDQAKRMQLAAKEKALNAQEKELKERESAIEKKEKAMKKNDKGMETKEKEIEIKQKTLEKRESALKVNPLSLREHELSQREKAFEEKEKIQTSRALANYRQRQDLSRREESLGKREALLEQREKHAPAGKHDDNLFHTGSNDSGTPSKQPEADSVGRIEQEVDQRRDTATFCATFRNTENHAEIARAIFKLNNFNPNVPTKIESTVQLSDLEGNLRAIKKGTTVADAFTIAFNVKWGRKRKRDDDDDGGDEAGPPAARKVKRTKAPAKKPSETQRLLGSPSKKSPPPRRRSTRENKG